MKNGKNMAIVAIVIVAVMALLIAKNAGKKRTAADALVASGTPAAAEATGVADSTKAIPRLVDLGASKCIPCKMMAPILEELKTTYSGIMDVQFIDVWKNPDVAKKYGINVIPTQIFYDAKGKELFRHEGFFGKEDILAKWKELGVELTQ